MSNLSAPEPQDSFSTEQHSASEFQWQQQPGMGMVPVTPGQGMQPPVPVPQQYDAQVERNKERAVQTARLAMTLGIGFLVTAVIATEFTGDLTRILATAVAWCGIAAVAWVFNGRQAPWSNNSRYHHDDDDDDDDDD